MTSSPSPLRPPGAVRAPEVPGGLPWFNAAHPLRLADFRGRFVLLDFWTAGCINCLHVLPDLVRLEKVHGDALVVLGVHAPKFAEERTAEGVRAAVQRYGITHPVVSDADLRMWNAYAIRAWPTLVLVDPEGYIVAQRSGEGAFEPFDRVLQERIPTYAAAGRLRLTTTDEPQTADPAPVAGEARLRFPAGLAADPIGGRLFVADTGHHRILVADVAGRILGRIGTGRAGLGDGPTEAATFRHPRGLSYDPTADVLYVADTGNHAVRRVELGARQVATLAGNGAQAPWGAMTTEEAGGALSSPWDVLFHEGRLFVAMAGTHQIWLLDAATGRGQAFAGNGYEHLVDAPRREAQLAQPSALATDGTMLFFLDAESSALRRVDFGEDARVDTLIGEGLFAFGDVDGRRPRARLQHPLGLTWADGRLFLADTYNHRLKAYDHAARAVFTLAGSGTRGRADGGPHAAAFDEPGALAWDGARLVIADTNNHRLATCDPATGTVATLSLTELTDPTAASHPTQTVAPGVAEIELRLTLPDGFGFNPVHPGTVRLRADDFIDEGTAAPTIRFRTTLRDDAVLHVEGTVYFCPETGGTCHAERIALRLPVTVHAEAARTVRVEVDVAPPPHSPQHDY